MSQRRIGIGETRVDSEWKSLFISGLCKQKENSVRGLSMEKMR